MRADEFLTEVPLPADWDPKIYSEPATFKVRLQYALDRAQRIGAGSSRVAMIIPYEGRDTVLKVAKNAKGIAQNNAEYDIMSDGYVRSMGSVIPVIDAGTDTKNHTTWIQTELAEKATPSKFKAYFGSGFDLMDLYKFTMFSVGDRRYKTRPILNMNNENTTQEQWDRFYDCSGDLATLNTDFNVELGDFIRPANWGFYQGRPVVIDIGFTSEVKDTHYSR